MSTNANFQPHQNAFRYRTAEDGDIVQVDIDYWRDARVRGLYITFAPATITDGLLTVPLSKMKSTMLAACPRVNPKLLASIAQRLDAAAPQLADVSRDDPSRALTLAKELAA